MIKAAIYLLGAVIGVVLSLALGGVLVIGFCGTMLGMFCYSLFKISTPIDKKEGEDI